MNREEAKEILTHNWTRVDNPNYSESELDEAFFMAIEALHREEAEAKGYCHRIRPSNVEVVVRCKDCRHAQYDATHYFCAEHHHKVYEDDYCSHGERREE